MDAGADFITTQLFFDNSVYFDFVSRCRSRGIEIPILPGLLPVLSIGQVRRFCTMCEAGLPSALEQGLEAAPEDEQPVVGADWALSQTKSLLTGGAPGYHLYALNKSDSTLRILEGLQANG